MVQAAPGVAAALATFVAFVATVGTAAASTDNAKVGSESVPYGEEQAIATIVATVRSIVNAATQAGEKPVLRDAHAKGHGCVQARVTVRPNLPRLLRQGVFARATTYPAWIRFSNGNGAPQDDHAGDGRGMAIKLIGVKGPKLLADEATAKTQDFVMINHPVFFVRNAADYVIFTSLTKKTAPMSSSRLTRGSTRSARRSHRPGSTMFSSSDTSA